MGSFQKAQIHPHPTYGSGVTITERWGRVSSGQIKLSGQFWTLSPIPQEFRVNLEYENPREFCILSNGG
jgi:hypothetical protein